VPEIAENGVGASVLIDLVMILTDLSRNAFTLSDGAWEKEGGGLAKIVACTSLDSISMVSCQKNVKKI
jgi:hypothetical protein